VPQYAYHTDFNVQVAVSLMMQDQKDVAASKLTKAIYACEQTLHPAFRMGESRLPYKYRENRVFHIALVRHLMALSKRQCNRSALEVWKVTFSLDPTVDPLGCAFIVDSLAVRAQQTEWLCAFCDVLQVSVCALAHKRH
jgi:hypothetical protein